MVAPAPLWCWRFQIVSKDSIRSGFVLGRSISQAINRANVQAAKTGGEVVGLTRHCKGTAMALHDAELLYCNPHKIPVEQLLEMLTDECRRTEAMAQVQAIKVERYEQFKQTKGY